MYKSRLLGPRGLPIADILTETRQGERLEYGGLVFKQIRPGVYFNASGKPVADTPAKADLPRKRPAWKFWSRGK